VSVGDILEIRAVIAIASADSVDRLTYRETIPAGVSYMINSLRAITNEGAFGPGIPNTGIYSDNVADDRGTLVLAGTTIHINLGDGAGFGTTSSDGGQVLGGITIPTFFGINTIIQAAYRVTVTAPLNTLILLNSGQFEYRHWEISPLTGIASFTPMASPVPAISIRVLADIGCTNVNTANLVTAETGGSFSQGTLHDRGASPNAIGFTYSGVTVGTPNDGAYSVAKNTSPTQYTGATPVATDRAFTVWDIIGDHTGTNNAAGNPPSAVGVNGGYMLVVNATYAPSAIFQAGVTGLTTNTVYTLTFWVRNLCPLCGASPLGGASGTPGVRPNLSFEINGAGAYTTGELAYSGSWIQKSFTFNSGALTSATITIKNNAPGGGGNDWALDDISLGTCLFVLPVRLEAFNGRIDNGLAVLQWEVDPRSSPGEFEVERSENGRDFRSVGRVEAGSERQYGLTDPDQFTGTMYYRLKMVDRGGRASYSMVVPLRNGTPNQDRIRLLPNPASGPVFLAIESAVPGLVQVQVSDLSGRVHEQLKSQVSPGFTQLALLRDKPLLPGIYLVRVTTPSGSWQEKLIVQ
jgi:hypothetical protein